MLTTVEGRSAVAEANEHRREVAGQREQAGHVDAQDPVERLPRIGLERLAPADAGVVDQNVQRVGAPARLGGERGDARLGRDRAAKALARADRRKLFRRRLAGLRLARGDQHARAGGEHRLGADSSEPGRAAGDERGASAEEKRSDGASMEFLPVTLSIRPDPSKLVGKAKLRP